MQILAGKFRRRHLQSANSYKVRPTARRLREAIFDLLGPRIEGARFLDLCAGSGAVGIEALSRGASHAAFVDHSRRMCSFIEANLNICGVPEGCAEIFMIDAVDFLRRARRGAIGGGARWDVAFFDPPYGADYMPVLRIFGGGAVLARGHGLLVVEHHRSRGLGERPCGVLHLLHLLEEGESCVSFYAPRET
jgi:16S rRNA (guanine(966)-N(2))-methyltransferase RsmD